MKGFDERARELRLLNLRVWKEGALVLSKDYDSEMLYRKAPVNICKRLLCGKC